MFATFFWPIRSLINQQSDKYKSVTLPQVNDFCANETRVTTEQACCFVPRAERSDEIEMLNLPQHDGRSRPFTCAGREYRFPQFFASHLENGYEYRCSSSKTSGYYNAGRFIGCRANRDKTGIEGLSYSGQSCRCCRRVAPEKARRNVEILGVEKLGTHRFP